MWYWSLIKQKQVHKPGENKNTFKLNCTLVCSMKASLILSLTSPCIDVASRHFCSGGLLWVPLTFGWYVKYPVWWKGAKDREKAGKSYRVTVNTVQPLRLQRGYFVSTAECPYPSPCNISACPQDGVISSSAWGLNVQDRLAALLSFNETFLFMTPKLNFSVTGVTALVAELHRGPVVIGASLRTIDSSC